MPTKKRPADNQEAKDKFANFLLAQLKLLHKMVKKHPTDRNYRGLNSTLHPIAGMLAETIHRYRGNINDLRIADPLKLKAQWFSSYGRLRKTEQDIFVSNDRLMCREYKTNETPNRIYVCRPSYPLICKNAQGIFDAIEFSSYRFWADEVKKYVATRDYLGLHSKLYNFRIGDEYYKNELYFCYDGQPYDRKKWALGPNNKLIDLSKNLCLPSTMRMPNCWDSSSGSKSNTYYLENDGKKFVSVDDVSSNKAYIRISHRNMDYSNRELYHNNFYNSMFSFGDERPFCSSNSSSLLLTKEQCRQLCFAPSNKHRELYLTIQNDYEKYLENRAIKYNKERFDAEFKNSLYFKVDVLEESGSSIKCQIFKELFGERWLSAKELSIRLQAMREILAKEKEYADRKQARQIKAERNAVSLYK